MYAVIKTGGKQYRVTPGDTLKVERLVSDVGEVVTMDQVLSVSNGEKSLIGEPVVEGASVSATVIEQGRHDKVRIFKMRRRKHYRKTQGHRQQYTEIFVSKIESSLGADSADAKEALDKAQARRDRVAAMTLGGEAEATAAAAAIAAYAAKTGKPVPAAAEQAPEAEKPAASPAPQAEQEATPKATPAPAAASADGDDLTKVEGIGPKINDLLKADGINSFADLAAADVEKIREILKAAGSTFASRDPSTWPDQAKLAADGKWDELKKWQDELDGGRA